MNFDNLCLLKAIFTSHKNCHLFFSVNVFRIYKILLLSFFTLVICFYFLFLISFLRYISVLWIFNNHAWIVQAREHVCIFIVFLFSISFISALILIISFFNFYFYLLFFLSFLRWKLRLLTWDLFSFLIQPFSYKFLFKHCLGCIPQILICLCFCHQFKIFWVYYVISFLSHWLFRSVGLISRYFRISCVFIIDFQI